MLVYLLQCLEGVEVEGMKGTTPRSWEGMKAAAVNVV